MNTNEISARDGHEQGQTMAEYAVILGVITPVIIVAFALLSGAAARAIDRVASLIGSL